MDGPTLSAGAALVRPGGRVALFASSGQELSGIPESLRLDRTSPLIGDSTLTELVRV
jgi:hypothetical protein